jgi:6-pyruvoyltetrahydropterin/6-carboxytetrahydropterin synthase
MAGIYELIVQTDFAGAHCLRGYEGACERLHGHNYKIDVVLRGERLGPLGMLVDFKVVKRAVADVIDRFDHRLLNEVPPFDSVNPTAENIARVIAEGLDERLPEGVGVARVTAWESDRCGVTFVP